MTPSLLVQKCKNLYSTGSLFGKFYGTLKLYKILSNRTVNELLTCTIISNIGKATYQLTKFLAKLMSPLANSECTIRSTKDSIIPKKQKAKMPND